MEEYGVELVRCLFLAGPSEDGRGIALGFDWDWDWAETAAFACSAIAEAEMLCVLRRFVSI